MLRFYDYIFYRQYAYTRDHGRGKLWAGWSAFCWVSTIVMLNIYGIFSLAEVITHDRILERFFALPKLELYGIYLILIEILYLFWGKDARCSRIIAEFEKHKETERQKMLRNVGIWVYVLMWGALIICCLTILRYRNIAALHGSG